MWSLPSEDDSRAAAEADEGGGDRDPRERVEMVVVEVVVEMTRVMPHATCISVSHDRPPPHTLSSLSAPASDHSMSLSMSALHRRYTVWVRACG